MKTQASLYLLLICLAGAARADWHSPGTGIQMNADSLVALSGGAVTGSNGVYQIHQSLFIEQSDLLVLGSDSLLFQDTAGQLKIEVYGSLQGNGEIGDSLVFTSPGATPGDWFGLVFRDTDDTSQFQLDYTVVEYGTRSLDAVDAAVQVSRSCIRYSSEVAVDLTESHSTILLCELYGHQQRVFNMTLSSSPLIESNLLYSNNLENSSPYPHISIGLQGINSPLILNNTILGGSSQSGGIAIWANSQALIEENYIEGCGYGILCYQAGADPEIRNNTLVDNTANADTLMWGFGIACNGPNSPLIAGNRIRGHHYGLAITGGASPNVGNVDNIDPDDDGENEFLGNGVSHPYELYNNNAQPVMAQNNWWGTSDPDSVELKIIHQVDNPAYGLVTFTPFMETWGVASEQNVPEPTSLLTLMPAYPNPFNPTTTIEYTIAVPGKATVSVYNIQGQLVDVIQNEFLPAGLYSFNWEPVDLPSGIYFLELRAGENRALQKMSFLK